MAGFRSIDKSVLFITNCDILKKVAVLHGAKKIE